MIFLEQQKTSGLEKRKEKNLRHFLSLYSQAWHFSLHPSIHVLYALFPYGCSHVHNYDLICIFCWYLSPVDIVRGVGYTLTRLQVRHRATQRQRLTLENSELPISLKIMFLVCGRILEYLEKTRTCTNMQTPHKGWEEILLLFCCEVTVLTIVLTCHPHLGLNYSKKKPSRTWQQMSWKLYGLRFCLNIGLSGDFTLLWFSLDWPVNFKYTQNFAYQIWKMDQMMVYVIQHHSHKHTN